MKKSTFEKRTANESKTSNGYKYSIELLSGKDRVYTCHTSGSGRFITNIDRTDDTIRILTIAGLREGIDFVAGNSSPRGGKTGNYIELTSKGKNKRFNYPISE